MAIKKKGGLIAFSCPEGNCRVLLAISLVGIIAFILLLIAHNVDKKITLEDEQALKTMLSKAGYTPTLEKTSDIFQEQIKNIRIIQDSILISSPKLLKIPLYQSREPADLLKTAHGQCSDRARSIEKGLKVIGFKTRFAAIFSREKTFTPPATMAIDSGYDLRSHAVIEVLTSKGWLIVDTNSRWLSLNENNEPVSLSELQDIKDKPNLKWSKTNKGEFYWLLKGPFTYVYGLYSRHGLFYPPFTPYIPDINWSEFIIDNIVN